MRRKKQESGIEYDEKLLQHIAPIGNMTPYNSYCRTGTGYEACVHIFSLPTMLDDFWMTDICNFQNSVATISIGTMDEVKVKQNLNKAIEEQASRITAIGSENQKTNITSNRKRESEIEKKQEVEETQAGIVQKFLIGDGTIDAQVKINEKEAQEAVWNKKGRVYVATGYQFDGSYTEYDLTEQEKEDLKNFIEENHIELDEQSELLVLKQEMELKTEKKEQNFLDLLQAQEREKEVPILNAEPELTIG